MSTKACDNRHRVSSKPPDWPGQNRAPCESPDMTDHLPRLFSTDADIRRVGEGLLDRTLPRAEWTHEAHLAACLWLMRERPDIVPERDLPTIISAYNEAVGGVNDDTQGYHETITQGYIRGVACYLGEAGREPLCHAVNGLLASRFGRRDWLLAHYSRERLFSVQARREFVPPDLAPLPELG